MNHPVEVVGLDADDTLWHSEIYFDRTQRRFDEIVSRYVGPEVDVHRALDAVASIIPEVHEIPVHRN